MSNKDQIQTQITYLGHDVRKTLEQDHEVTRAVWGYCCALGDAFVKVHVGPRNEGIAEWHLIVVTPYGRRTVTAYQRAVGGAVSFAPA